jgi:hypothetical protein
MPTGVDLVGHSGDAGAEFSHSLGLDHLLFGPPPLLQEA